jgi:hypothetical protein
VADHRALLAGIPLLWMYPSTEPWSEGFRAQAPEPWTFVQHGEQHGTKMFDKGELEGATLKELVRFVGRTAE